MNKTNIVLTGVPRSGTTLTCHLLNKLPDSVALHEPMTYGRFDPDDQEAILDGIEQFYRRMRRMIRKEGVAFSKEMEPQITDKAHDLTSEAERRSRAVGNRRQKRREQKVAIDKDLERNFYLVIKQPAMFTALLPSLVRRYTCYATIRNPLAVLASWNTINRHTRDGHAPGAERYDKDLRRALDSIEDRTERQLCLLSWFFQRYRTTLPEDHVIRYEEVVASGGAALSTITSAAEALDEPLPSRNLSPIYDREEMLELGKRLLDSDGAYWYFYPRESVEELLEGFD
jgi:hypothetical protein